MTIGPDQKAKAQQLHALHRNGKMLMLPNVWDPLGASLLEGLEFPAIATASASIAFTNGYHDGEKLPFNEVVKQFAKIAGSVNIPVTADIESGYAKDENELRRNIEMLLDAGIAGINLEDTDKSSGKIYTAEQQCKRIALVKSTAAAYGVSLFINARTDVYLHNDIFDTDEKKEIELIKRGRAYAEAGADCFFPIVLKDVNLIRNLILELKLPVNILAIPGVPDFKTLKEIGVTRVSLGPGFLKIAIKAMKQLAEKLKDYDGMDEIAGNDITTDFLKQLIKTN